MHMKNILNKHKILVISSGILLSSLISFSMINSSLFNENNVKGETELTADSLTEFNQNEEKEVVEDRMPKEINKDNENNNEESLSILADNEELNNDDTKEIINSKNNKENNSASSEAITGNKYTVKKGDTLFLISQRANTSVNKLKTVNNLYTNTIVEGQVLYLSSNENSPITEIPNRGSQRDEDLYWLSRIINSEAQGESYEGKVAVGNVIINRVNSPKFPNTIKGVVFDKQNGYTQFSPVIDGTIYNSPDADSIKAAKDVLNGSRPVGDALYFLNPRKSTNFWIVENRQHIKTIGLHDFYY